MKASFRHLLVKWEEKWEALAPLFHLFSLLRATDMKQQHTVSNTNHALDLFCQ